MSDILLIVHMVSSGKEIFRKTMRVYMMKFSKMSVSGLVLLICVALLLPACSGRKHISESTTKKTEVPSSPATIAVADPIIQYLDDDFVEVDQVDTPVSLDSAGYEKLLAYIDAMETQYPYSELFNLEAARESRDSFSAPSVHRGDIRNQNGQFSIDLLVDAVIKNSDEYYEQLGSMNSFYKKMSEDDIREICKMILQYIEEADKFVEVDVDRVSCCLADLKMLYRPGGSAMASVNMEMLLSVNPSMISLAQVIASEQDAERDTLIHEIMHIIQHFCFDSEEKRFLGVSYQDTSLDINPLYWSWYTEAAAEKCTMDLTGDPNIVYPTQIGYMESIALPLTLSERYHVRDIELYTLDKTVDDFYSLFDLQESEIDRMMYSIELIQAEPEEFSQQYKLACGDALTDEKMVEIKRQVKGSICESLSKQFYRNLTQAVYHGNVTLEDVFYLLRIFEADAFSHLRYDNPDKKVQCITFLENYTQLQNTFFSLIKTGDLTSDDIFQYFDKYSTRAVYQGTEKTANCDLDWLGIEKRDYIVSRKDAVYSSQIAHIRDVLASPAKEN